MPIRAGGTKKRQISMPARELKDLKNGNDLKADHRWYDENKLCKWCSKRQHLLGCSPLKKSNQTVIVDIASIVTSLIQTSDFSAQLRVMIF